MFLDLCRIYSPTFCTELDPDATYDDSTNHAIEQWEKLIYTHKAENSKKMFFAYEFDIDIRYVFQQTRSVGPILGQSRRRWTTVSSTLGQSLVFARLFCRNSFRDIRI